MIRNAKGSILADLPTYKTMVKGSFGQKFPVDMLKYAAWERHCFFPEKIGQKLVEIWGIQYNSLKKKIFVRLWLT